MSIAEAASLVNTENFDLLFRLGIVANAGLLIFAALYIEKAYELKDYVNNPDKSYYDEELKKFIKAQRNFILKDSRITLIKGIVGVLLACLGIGFICFTAADYSYRSAAFSFAAFGVVTVAMRAGLIVISDYFTFKGFKKHIKDNSLALAEVSSEQKKSFNRAFPLFAGCTVLSVYLLSQVSVF